MERLDKNTLPEFCPMKTSEDLVKSTRDMYDQDRIRKIYVPATETATNTYQVIRGARMAVRPRIKEIVEFSKLMGFKRLGVAFCIGLRDEAKRVVDVLEQYGGFEVASSLCKCGGVDKFTLGVRKIGEASRHEAACNPILQADLLNQAKTDLNIIVGLCLGHDIIFTQNSEAPVTTLIVKDRLLGHNPVIALYSGYHQGILKSQEIKETLDP